MKHSILTSVIAASVLILSSPDTATGSATGGILAPEVLSQMNFGILVDKSKSMTWEVGGTGPDAKMTRWDYTKRETHGLLLSLLEVDPTGGIEIAFFNDTPFTAANIITVSTPAQIDAAFAANPPMGGTIMAPALREFCKVAQKSYTEGRNYMLMIATDGMSDDKDEIRACITAQATVTNQAQDEFFSIGIIQVGHDPVATKFIGEVDNGIAKAGVVHDIVGSINMDQIAGKKLGEIAYIFQNC